jgi:hypothetical protein
MTQPDDRELEQYLEGNSKLSRRYREASAESAPPELDDAILARARAETKRKPPSLNRILAPVALAASVVLGVNLAWNLYQVEPVPGDLRQPQAKAQSRDNTFVPPPPAAPAPVREEKRAAEADALQRRDAELSQQREQEASRKQKSEERLASRARPAEAPQPEPEPQSFAADEPAAGAAASPPQAMAKSAAPAAALADTAAPLSEPQKIDRLIAYVGGLQGAVFIRNGKEYGPAEAAKHMQLKREKAGVRCATADSFIRLCASFSSTSGDAYLIRFADGRTRTAEDVLREELARM